MVSRLFGKLDAQRQRMLGNEGVCAIACDTASPPAAAAAPRPRNFLRFISSPLRVESARSSGQVAGAGPLAGGESAIPPPPMAGRHYRGGARALRGRGLRTRVVQ